MVGLAACASVTKGTTQTVFIDTPGAAGATCTLSSEGIGTRTLQTPASVVLDKSQHNVAVSCKKACFQEGKGVIGSTTEAMVAGNLLAGGVIGLGIDAASGAMNKYNEQNQIAMVPIVGCKA
jgi:hypothetical protein